MVGALIASAVVLSDASELRAVQAELPRIEWTSTCAEFCEMKSVGGPEYALTLCVAVCSDAGNMNSPGIGLGLPCRLALELHARIGQPSRVTPAIIQRKSRVRGRTLRNRPNRTANLYGVCFVLR